MMHRMTRRTAAKARRHLQVYNLGVDEYCRVNDSVHWICAALGVQPRIEYSGGDRGWVGDNPFIFLDTKKIRNTGWKPTLTIEQGILRTLQWLQHNQWILERR